MNKIFLVAVGISATQNVWAQQEQSVPKYNQHMNYKYSVKLYNESGFREGFKIGYQQPTQKFFRKQEMISNILKPTIAMQWKNKRNNFHEIELNRFNIEKENSDDKNYSPNGQFTILAGEKIINTNIALRYEYILQFCKTKDYRIVPSLGLAAYTFYERQNYKPRISNSFPSTYTETGIKTFIIPRLSYYFSKKFYCDLNVPLCIANMSFIKKKIEDPALNNRQQNYEVVNFETFPKQLNVRLGIGMKI